MITKITPYKLSQHSCEHEVLVALKYNPKRQRILVSLNNTLVEGVYNPKTKNVTANISAVSPGRLRELPVNPDIRVKVFVYDSYQDKIIEAKSQEFAYQAEVLNYKANATLLDTPPVIMEFNDTVLHNFWLF